LGDDVVSQVAQCLLGEGPGFLDAAAVRAVRVAVPGDQVGQRELVDPVVVLGLDPVGVGLAVLAEQDQMGTGPNVVRTRSG
jgi:hypothetical protein